MPETLSPEIIAGIRRALDEDIGAGDATTDSIVPADATSSGRIIAKQDGVVAGLDVAAAGLSPGGCARQLLRWWPKARRCPTPAARGRSPGQRRALLTAERTALQLPGRMSGIATLTRRFVDAVAGTRAVILDTRKTAPGLRSLDKLAVRRGGGQNHRIGLYDMILIKDNHIDYAGSLDEAVRRARAAHSGLEIEVEARTLAEVRPRSICAWRASCLDNMTPT